MKVSEIDSKELNEDLIDKILYEGIEDTGVKGDCIMVLGSLFANKYRTPKAVELYQNKRSNKILICGGKKVDNEITEASMMKDYMLNQGIPDDAIILENESQTTIENMTYARLYLDKEFGLKHIKTILLVTTRFHMRRSIQMAKTYLPSSIKIIPCPADDRNTQRHNWYKSEGGYKRAKLEAIKVISYIREGSMLDFDI